MTQTQEALVEVMADAIGEFMGAKDRLDAYHFDAANHLMRALEASGVRLVPSEVTHKMADVGTEARWQSAVRDANNVREIWRAMLAASPYALKETGQ